MSNFELVNFNFQLKPGELCVVVGQVGCGKSTLLISLLSEMQKVTGTFSLNGRKAYSS